jgi:hypothetical protein
MSSAICAVGEFLVAEYLVNMYSFIKQYMHKNDIVMGFVWRDSNILVMVKRQVLILFYNRSHVN